MEYEKIKGLGVISFGVVIISDNRCVGDVVVEKKNKIN